MEQEHYPICTCGKVSFPSRRIAQTRVNSFKKNKKARKKIPKRSYYSEECQTWHITSKKPEHDLTSH